MGIRSTAWGMTSQALGTTSTAFGSNAIAEGNGSTAFGNNPVAQGHNSTAIGQYVTVTGDNSVAVGFGTSAERKYLDQPDSFGVIGGTVKFCNAAGVCIDDVQNAIETLQNENNALKDRVQALENSSGGDINDLLNRVQYLEYKNSDLTNTIFDLSYRIRKLEESAAN
ncbi:hypothetical protein [Thalassomonas sp. RHCl1]|uniref:hypothetical protein n=1 Tax=Thalassomonas sp. RHCl1 TaxID=2995320 RepID=UPI00248B6E46|nr:hypothetical protein [Thalassomonas sp. RHCl1]